MVSNKSSLEAVEWLVGKEIIGAFLVVIALVGAATLIQIQAVQIPGYIIMLGSDLIQNPYLPGLTGLAYDIFFVVYLYGVAVLLGNLYRFVRSQF